MKISVCVDAVYAGKNMRDAIDDVLANGLDTIEFWGWEDKDIQKLAQYQKKYRSSGNTRKKKGSVLRHSVQNSSALRTLCFAVTM